MCEVYCPECGWYGDWSELKPIKYDGEHVPACPECTGIDIKQATDGEEEDNEDD